MTIGHKTIPHSNSCPVQMSLVSCTLQADTFALQLRDLGELQHLTIGHDGHGWGSGWHLKKVVVTHAATGRQWLFPCGRWLDENREDGLTVRTLKVGCPCTVAGWNCRLPARAHCGWAHQDVSCLQP